RRRDHEAGRAEPTLRPVLLVERRLDGRELAGLAETLDGRDARAVDGGERDETGAPRLAVDEHRAGAAAAFLTARLGARDPELLAQRVQERVQRCERELAFGAVDGQLHRSSSRARSTSPGSTWRRYHPDASASSCGSTSSSALAAASFTA